MNLRKIVIICFLSTAALSLQINMKKFPVPYVNKVECQGVNLPVDNNCIDYSFQYLVSNGMTTTPMATIGIGHNFTNNFGGVNGDVMNGSQVNFKISFIYNDEMGNEQTSSLAVDDMDAVQNFPNNYQLTSDVPGNYFETVNINNDLLLPTQIHLNFVGIEVRPVDGEDNKELWEFKFRVQQQVQQAPQLNQPQFLNLLHQDSTHSNSSNGSYQSNGSNNSDQLFINRLIL